MQADTRARTQDARRVAAGAVDTERPQRRRSMPAEWTQNTRKVDAKRPQGGRKTPADAVPSYFLAVLYVQDKLHRLLMEQHWQDR